MNLLPANTSLPLIIRISLTLKEPILNLLIRFILNNKDISTDMPTGHVLVDYIRYEQLLKGTKIGCREGDCGACVVLVGELKNGEMVYQSLTSCLTPLANVQGKHVVTIEGINRAGLNPIQQAMSDESATQCGFCTPGFVMSFTGFSLGNKNACTENAIAAVDGNICRCTGYKSIERAANNIAGLLKNKPQEDVIGFLSDHDSIPVYFKTIKERLQLLASQTNGVRQKEKTGRYIGGGTDLYVHQQDELKQYEHHYLVAAPHLKGICKEGNNCVIGASTTVTELAESPLMRQLFPKIDEHVKLISSTPIRNMATIAGNFINASPIGDLTIFFLALNASVLLTDGKNSRELPLRKLYLGYKSLDKHQHEYIEKIMFSLPGENTFFHFEKGSKRSWLDIATVNTAMSITMNDMKISDIHISAGGVAPIPLYLKKTCSYLKEKALNEDNILRSLDLVQTEIFPIDDVRGGARYKRLLLVQLIKAHFITLFPSLDTSKLIQHLPQRT